MDFSNNMLKKIMYILIIVSLLLSIKTKVFGAYNGALITIDGEYKNGTSVSYNVPDFPSGCDSYLYVNDLTTTNIGARIYYWNSENVVCFCNEYGAIHFYDKVNFPQQGSYNWYYRDFLGYSFDNYQNWLGLNTYTTDYITSGQSYTSGQFISNDTIYDYSTFNSSSLADNTPIFTPPSTFLFPFFDEPSDLEDLSFNEVFITPRRYTSNWKYIFSRVNYY